MNKNQEYVVGLERLIKSGATNEDIYNWYSQSRDRYSNSIIKRTLKRAGRDDLIEFLIEESDIKLGDTVKSKMTARIGEVVGIRSDGDTIEVKWSTGGIQLLSKESVYIYPQSDNVEMSSDFKKVHTETDPYKDFDNRNIFNNNRDDSDK